LIPPDLPSFPDLLTSHPGIGLGLLKQYAQRPNTTVIAAVRDPTKSAAIEAVVPSKGSKIILVKIDSISETDPFSTATELQTKHGIQHLDVVIANAGIANHWGPALSTPAAELSSHFLVNTVGTLLLFQATLPLLEKSLNPKFVALSTGIASMGDMEMYPLPNTAYGASKAALNFVVRKLHIEHENVTIFPISPGADGYGDTNSAGFGDGRCADYAGR
jgi:norsolorinic acid ketoreductase